MFTYGRPPFTYWQLFTMPYCQPPAGALEMMGCECPISSACYLALSRPLLSAPANKLVDLRASTCATSADAFITANATRLIAEFVTLNTSETADYMTRHLLSSQGGAI